MKNCEGCPQFNAKRKALNEAQVVRDRIVAVTAGTIRLIVETEAALLSPIEEEQIDSKQLDLFYELALDRSEEGKAIMARGFAEWPTIAERHFAACDAVGAIESEFETDIEKMQSTCIGPVANPTGGVNCSSATTE